MTEPEVPVPFSQAANTRSCHESHTNSIRNQTSVLQAVPTYRSPVCVLVFHYRSSDQCCSSNKYLSQTYVDFGVHFRLLKIQQNLLIIYVCVCLENFEQYRYKFLTLVYSFRVISVDASVLRKHITLLSQ